MSHARRQPLDPERRAARARDAWGALLVVAAGIAVTSGGMRLVSEAHRGAVVSTVYSAWLGFALWYALRQGSLATVGLSGRRFWLALGLAVPVSILLVLGTLGDPTMKGATLAVPAALELMTMVLISFTAALAEQLAIIGYLQLRFEEAFGRLAGILVSATMFTVFHLVLLWLPGAVPPQGAGLGQLALGLFIGLALWAGVFTYTRNVWALALAAGLNSLLLNLYRLNVRPEEVLINDPSSLTSGIPLLLGCLFAIWLVSRMIAASRGPSAGPAAVAEPAAPAAVAGPTSGDA